MQGSVLGLGASLEWGLSWAVVCHSLDTQGAFGVASNVFIPRLPSAGPEELCKYLSMQVPSFQD
jgi:hypothetical protein